MNLIGLLSEVFKPACELVDEMHTSDDERLQAKHRLTELYLGFISQALASEAKRMDAKAAVIVAEAKSTNLLTSSWRPVTMYAFLIMLVCWWFGWIDTPQAATPEVLEELFSLLKIGIGGYIGSRGVEKVVPSVLGALKKKEDA
jgi:hypothetical protein